MADGPDADAGAKKPRKVTRRRGNTLEKWEVALVKAMLAWGGYNDQDILAYFTRPTRSVNHRLIGEIRVGAKHKSVNPASSDELDEFLATWPDIDHETGLSVRGDELLIKAREAMIAAVHVFNSAGLTFRAELFIVTCIIAWTYLMHAWFKREGVDYKYPADTTPNGAVRYWDLSKCLKHPRCPAKSGIEQNLRFLMELRHEIEHRSTSRIDDAVGAKLQSCCINFNNLLKAEFGGQFGLEKRLPIALQFVSFGADQRSVLKKACSLPRHVAFFIDAFEHGLSQEQLEDPAYRMKIAFVPVAAKKPGAADSAIEFLRADSDEAQEINRVVFKEVERNRYPPSKVVQRVQAAGFPKFRQHDHTQLWQGLKAQEKGKGYGCVGDYGNWVWYDRWIDRVLEHCEEQGDRYR